MGNYNKWNEEELKIIKDVFLNTNLTINEIHKKFFNYRTQTSVSVKIKKLKLKRTKEQKKIIWSKAHSGINNGMCGKKSWSNGLTKHTNNSLKSASEKLSVKLKSDFACGKRNVSGENNGMYGKKSWNSGLNKSLDIRIKNFGRKSSKTKIENWKKLPEKEKEIRRIRWARAGLKCKKKLTSIEVKIAKLLKELNINFIQNKPINKFIVDFFIPDNNLVIECQGDYWHANPNKYDKKDLSEMQIKNIDRDNRKKLFLNKNNFKSLFIWEYDINNKIDLVKILLNEKTITNN